MPERPDGCFAQISPDPFSLPCRCSKTQAASAFPGHGRKSSEEGDGVTDGRKIEAKSLSGSVRYDGDIYSDGRYYLKSHSGDITMMIPASSAFDLDAKTFSGDIDTEFDVMISGKISKKSIRGSVNNGGADVDIKTFSGDIRLKKK